MLVNSMVGDVDVRTLAVDIITVVEVFGAADKKRTWFSLPVSSGYAINFFPLELRISISSHHFKLYICVFIYLFIYLLNYLLTYC